MMQGLKAEYGWFKAREPGHRFQDRHQRKQERRRGARAGRMVKIGLALLVLFGGLFFLPAPGPGTLISILGLALLADEIGFFARFLDKAEERIRPWAERAIAAFRGLSPVPKTLVVLLALVVAAGLGYGGWRMWFGS